jgi:hypothetical protein
MKIKALALAAVFVAGAGASLAIAKSRPPRPGSSVVSSIGALTTSKPRCDQVELKGDGARGGVIFTVRKANKRARNLVGTQVLLSIRAGSRVTAKACSAGTALTLRDLHVEASPTKP